MILRFLVDPRYLILDPCFPGNPQCIGDSRYEFQRMPKEKQTRKQWITKIWRNVGPYFKVAVFLFCFCLFVVVVFVFSKNNTIPGLALMLVMVYSTNKSFFVVQRF